ncbi:mycothione reductase [Gulosibacter sediminis]|uniref:mycothione reductase n=1 Tax=Gulosibacter sediminis TaxID=1729695 RepID=UPI001865F5C2|nr:mycothione reductase [Gulosibacter sediminis]
MAVPQTEYEEFDLIIIGAGSGNTIPGPDFADWRIAIVDDGRWFGGTCLNAGCIPTKMFVHPSDVAREVRQGGHLGVHGSAELDWAAVRDRVFGRIDSISHGGEAYRDHGEPNISLVRETVQFTGERELTTVSGRRLRGERIVIAAGSRPRELPNLPFGDTVISSDDALRLDALPASLLVIGGGAVASEFAAVYSAFGVEVTQLNRSPLLRSADADVSETFTKLAGEQWSVRTGVTVASAEHRDSGWQLTLDDGSELSAELVLVAAGRIPNTDRLGVDAAGFDVRADGTLAVDLGQRVLRDGEPVDGIYALGDVSSPHQLKHVANQDARIVAENLRRTARGEALAENTLGPVPYAVFSAPEVAHFGLTLAEATEQGMDAFEVRHDYGWTAWGWALDDEVSFLKIVVERVTGKLLGAHIIGPDAPILLQPLLQAASFNQSVRGLARGQYWPHPAATEIIENALLKAEEELQA